MEQKHTSPAGSELDSLKETVQNLSSANAQLNSANAQLTAENAELKRKLERMNELLLLAQRARFGQSSEKREYVMQGGDQLQLFNEAEACQNLKEPEPTEETIVSSHTRKPRRTVDELTEGLPVEKVVLDIQEDERFCDTCGSPLKRIGEKFVRRELQVIPRQVKVLEIYSATYACTECEKNTGYGYIYTTETPPPLLKHSLASPSTVANVMTQKYVDGIPLARQEKIWKRDGIALSRATMANWVIQCAQTWLKPLYRHIQKQLGKLTVIHADETVVQVHREDGKANTSESRMWVYSSGSYCRTPLRFFEYQPDRSGKHPAALLRDFTGCLVTDGYAGYDKVPKAIRCGCWTHMRRKWREAMPKGATTATSKAALGYEYCNKLFALERKVETVAPSQRISARKAKEELLLDAYWEFVEKLDPAAGSKLEEAVTYARNQKQYLNAFMEHGEVDISNNIAENAIRPFVVGRKNWLFCDTPKGADSSAIVYTLVETAKANDVEPFAYLSYVLDNMRYLSKTPAAAELEAMMPWNPGLRAQLGTI